jgi:NAD(P)-dependent dehydrogenase (short-subunit alcohol dehydrogenase family)
MYAITGASDGLGLALATLLAAKGEKVVSLSRSKPKGKGIVHIACDLTNEGSINVAAEALLAMSEPLTALVNCAGVYSSQPLAELTGQDMATAYTTNAIGPVLLTARLIERVKKDNADIMNIDSASALQSHRNEYAYATSKWAMRGFSKNLQHELKGTTVRVINVCPDNFRDKPEGRQMASDDIAAFLLTILYLPKSIEVGEVTLTAK